MVELTLGAVGLCLILIRSDRYWQGLGLCLAAAGAHLTLRRLAPHLSLPVEAAMLAALAVALWLLWATGDPLRPWFHLEERWPFIYVAMLPFAAACLWAILTRNLIWLYVAVEVTTLTSAPLIALRSKPAAYKYLLMNILGLTAALSGLAIIQGAGGGPLTPRDAALAGGLLLAGLGTKAGLVPLHGWLPDAYEHCPAAFAPLFAGVGTKVALLAMIQTLPPLIAVAPAVGTATVVIACITMVVGVVAAFGQDDLRRLLAYSSVSQSGYIAMGIGVGGLAAAQMHIVSHGLLKALLFLCVAFLPTASIKQLERRPQRRWIGILFLVGALGLGGVPPLPAFWSKFALFVAAARGGYPWATGVAVGVSLLTITLLVRAGSRIFLTTNPEEGGEHPHGMAAADD